MTPGAVDVDGVSRRFVVRARETHTLKELLVARGRTGAQEVWALRDVSLAIAPGEAVALGALAWAGASVTAARSRSVDLGEVVRVAE